MSQPELLAAHFDEAFNAPDGLKRLRELILTLAMQGKLVEQDPSEGTADNLLRDIEAEKKRLVAEGKIKAPRPLPAIEPEEVPYELPQGWRWVRLGEVANSITGGGTPNKNNSSFWGGNIPWASVKDLNVDVYIDETIDKITQLGLNNSSSNLIEPGSIIVCTRMGLGKVAINRTEIAINQDLKALKLTSQIDQMFFLLKYKNYEIKGSGMTVAGIKQDELLNFPFPLPPLAEQRRIVARIDQLMARCDELEALRAQREQKRVQVHTAILREITADTDPTTFQQNWQFLADHFGELHATPQNVTELRSAILQLAVMGKLVPQDPAEGTARELLAEIEQEKRRLVAAGKIKAPKPRSPFSEAEQSYPVPGGWAWVRLEELFAIITDGDHQPPPKANSGIPFLVIGNLSGGTIDLSGCRYVPQSYYNGLDWGKKPLKGDLLYTVTGSFGITVSVHTSQEFCVQRHVAILKSTRQTPDTFIKYYLGSLAAKQYAFNVATGIAQKTVPLVALRDMPVSLPPLAEQRRIVAKVDQLMGLCDMLESRLRARTAKQGELLGAVMAELAPTLLSTRPTVASRVRAQAPAISEAPRGRGRPRKTATEDIEAAVPLTGERRGRSRPHKDGDSPVRSIPEAGSFDDAIRRIEALKLERAAGTRQVRLFDEEN